MTIRINNSLLKLASLATVVDQLKACNTQDLQVLAMPIPDNEYGAFSLTLSAPAITLTPMYAKELKRLDLMVLSVTSRRSGQNCVVDYTLVDLSDAPALNESAHPHPRGLIGDLHDLKEARNSLFHIMDRFFGGENLQLLFSLADYSVDVKLIQTTEYQRLVGDLIVEIVRNVDGNTERLKNQMDGL